MILTLKISPSPIDQERIELIMRAALSNREHEQGWCVKQIVTQKVKCVAQL